VKTSLKLRTYPRVDLAKVSNWLTVLSSYGLPLIEISCRSIAEKEKKGCLSAEIKNRLISWKESKGILDADDLEYKYFLERTGVVLTRQLVSEDKDVPIGPNLDLSMIIADQSSRIQLHYLSRLGDSLLDYWNSRQYHIYEAALFWLLIRTQQFNPLIQVLISDPRFYQTGFQDELIPSRDGISRVLVRKWLQYFSLIKNGRPDISRLATILLYAFAFEINELVRQRGSIKEYVSELCGATSRSFGITEACIDFGAFLDCLYSHADRQNIAGFPSGRGHIGLHSKPSVQIIEINSCIPISTIEKIMPYEVQRAIIFGGS
jgi:hypothetical protein